MEKIVKLEKDGSNIKIKENFLADIKDLFSGCSINFLIGAGFSASVLSALGNKEIVFQALKEAKLINSADNIRQQKLDIILAYEYWDFFEKSIKNISTLDSKSSSFEIYNEFAKIIYRILEDKSNPILNKQANIFTTNYDPILELAFENSSCMLNDGFEGRIRPVFATSNFSRSFYREAFYSNRKAEMPSCNLFKIHGSVTWEKASEDDIVYCDCGNKINKFYDAYCKLIDAKILTTLNTNILGSDQSVVLSNIEYVLTTTLLDSELINHGQYISLIEEYRNTFLIVNPTKEKFSDTLLNKNYYELLRMYSNELEKENSLLIVSGFSFADEHILDLSKRSMINPSLKVIIFCYEEAQIAEYECKFKDLKNENISYIYIEGNRLSVPEMNEILSYIHL